MKTIQRFLTVGLFMAISLLTLLEPAMARDPKIHVLFVWGTKATDTRDVVNESRKLFEGVMEEIDICQGGQYIASFTSLSGYDAHPANILKHCNRMAQAAGPDDALFVYILCHNVSIPDKETDKNPQQWVHVLSPIAEDMDHLELRTIGIKRSSILKAMKSTNHRLNVLITDSGYEYTSEIVHPKCLCAGWPSFLYLLLKESGTINWGSTNPIGGDDGSGEVSIGTHEGTLFMSVFCSCDIQHKVMKKNRIITPNDFFNELGSALANEYKEIRRRARETGNYYNYLLRQEQQTLTEFDDDGHVIRTWPNEKERVENKSAEPIEQIVQQRAVIAWNGYEDERGEETLILTTEEISATGQEMAMLSVLPLPGEPLDITETDPKVFNNAQTLLHGEQSPNAIAKTGDVVLERKTGGAHNIFVWKLDNVNSFKKDITAYIANKYGNQAAALIDKNTEKIIRKYYKRGFRYFAFDLTKVKDKPVAKSAIAYRFKSDHVYYPLQISQIGGSNTKTKVDLIIIAPEVVQPTGVVKVGKGKNAARMIDNKTAEFTRNEVENLDNALLAIFKNDESTLKVCEFVFEGSFNGFNGDFVARAYQEQKSTEETKTDSSRNQ